MNKYSSMLWNTLLVSFILISGISLLWSTSSLARIKQPTGLTVTSHTDFNPWSLESGWVKFTKEGHQWIAVNLYDWKCILHNPDCPCLGSAEKE